MAKHTPDNITDTALELNMANYFEYLDVLRASGATNMYGAGEFLKREFAMSKSNARKVLLRWMAEFKG